MTISGCQHPLVEDILQRKLLSRKSKWALPWAILNFVIAIILYCDLNQGSVSRYFQGNPPFIWHVEFILAAVFTLNGTYDMWIYAWPVLGQSPLEVSPAYKKLFSVKDNDIGFKYSLSSNNSPSPEPKGHSPRLTSFVLPSSRHSSNLSSSPSLLSSTPLDYSAASWQSSSLGSSPNNSLLSTSWTYFGHSPPYQTQNINLNISPYSPYKSIGEETVLRHRCEPTIPTALPDSTASNVSSFWNYPHTSTPFAPVLRKYQYQSATRSPQSAAACDDDPDSPSTHSGERILNYFGEYKVILKLKIPEYRLLPWISNFKRWIIKTILVKLASEIEAFNDEMRRLGVTGIQIGEFFMVSTLSKVTFTKAQHIHLVNGLIPYLDMSCNLKYLVPRLKDLASGGGLHDYRWSSGGGYKEHPWRDYLPTDCQILMHLFVTYMDSRLSPDPHYPDGKTFTSQYFKKRPDKYASKDALGIYQSKGKPPHYKVIIGEDTWDFPKGHTNMFIAIFFFLHHIKTKQCGMLGGVNLGPSGIDILWIIET